MANEVTDVEIRLVYADASETELHAVETLSGIRLNPGGTTPTTDPRLLPILAKTKGALEEDDKLIIYGRPTTTTNFDTNGELEIPVTIQNIKTKIVSTKVLERADFFTSDVAMTVNIWNKIGSYTITAQERLKIGHSIAENSRIRVVARSA